MTTYANKLRHAPARLLKERVRCPTCLHLFPIPLFQTLPQPCVPVTPLDFDPITNKKIWVPEGVSVKCPKCNGQTVVSFPSKTKHAEVRFYGDEAARQGYGIYTYSLLGADRRLMPGIEKQILAFKKAIAPSVAPESWRLHMTEAWSGQQRRHHAIFNQWSRDEVVALVDGLFDLLARLSKDLFIFNISLKYQTITESELRNVAYLSLVADLIDGFTEKGFQPHLFFDADRPVDAEYAIQGWARECFGGLQLTLLYPFLAKGIAIPEPRFVKPGSHPCLELADFVSFVVARYLLRRQLGKPIEFDPSRLGKVFYMIQRSNGDLVQLRQASYPSSELPQTS